VAGELAVLAGHMFRGGDEVVVAGKVVVAGMWVWS
jgi:hypothetical protein